MAAPATSHDDPLAAAPNGASAKRRLLVYGLGRSGTAVVQRAVAQSHAPSTVWFYEAREGGDDVALALSLGAARVADVGAWLAQGSDQALVVAAPGVPIGHPDLVVLRAGGAEVIGEVEWVFRQVPGRYIGITGTAGKGSVTRWCGDTLEGAGNDVVVGGNIVPALAAVAHPGAIHVVELSSFQLERCPTFAPDVAVVLNLGEDHIDRHGTVAAYHLAKKNLIRNLRAGHTLVINADDPLLPAWGDEAEARGVTVRRFSLAPAASGEAEPDAYLDAAGRLWLHGSPLTARSELQVMGDHQVANALATALACSALGATADQLRAGLTGFAGLPGRYSPAGAVGDVRFVEDSIATRPLAVEAAIRATPRPLVWLAGGQAKGSQLSHLAPLVGERVDLVLTFGASADAFADAFEHHAPTERIKEPTGEATMHALVRRAVDYLRQQHGGKGSVLLAPLAASFDQFADYQARATAFRQAVAEAAATVPAPARSAAQPHAPAAADGGRGR